jgi:hypothetical protein
MHVDIKPAPEKSGAHVEGNTFAAIGGTAAKCEVQFHIVWIAQQIPNFPLKLPHTIRASSSLDNDNAAIHTNAHGDVLARIHVTQVVRILPAWQLLLAEPTSKLFSAWIPTGSSFSDAIGMRVHRSLNMVPHIQVHRP